MELEFFPPQPLLKSKPKKPALTLCIAARKETTWQAWNSMWITCFSLAHLWALVGYRNFLSLKTLVCKVEVTLACRAVVRIR